MVQRVRLMRSDKGGVWGVGSGLVYFHMKGMLAGEPFSSPEIGLPWEGQSPQGSSKHQKHTVIN